MIGTTYFALTTPEEDLSFWEKLWNGFRELFIKSDGYYEHINVSYGTLLSVRLIILGLFVGMCIATFVTVFNKRVLGDVVRKLLSRDALSHDSALTLEELGYDKNIAIRLSLKYGTSLRRVVKSREEVGYYEELERKREEYLSHKKNGEKIPKFKEAPYKMDVCADHFYIPEDMKYMADIKFEKKGNTLLGAFLIVLGLAAAFLVIMYFLPDILSFINSIAAGFESTGNNKVL